MYGVFLFCASFLGIFFEGGSGGSGEIGEIGEIGGIGGIGGWFIVYRVSLVLWLAYLRH